MQGELPKENKGLKDSVRFFRLPRRKIVELIFTLEGYDGLCVVRTLDRRQGIVELLVPESQKEEFNKVLSSIKEDLSMEEIPKPEGLKSILDD